MSEISFLPSSPQLSNCFSCSSPLFIEPHVLSFTSVLLLLNFFMSSSLSVLPWFFSSSSYVSLILLLFLFLLFSCSSSPSFFLFFFLYLYSNCVDIVSASRNPALEIGRWCRVAHVPAAHKHTQRMRTSNRLTKKKLKITKKKDLHHI